MFCNSYTDLHKSEKAYIRGNGIAPLILCVCVSVWLWECVVLCVCVLKLELPLTIKHTLTNAVYSEWEEEIIVFVIVERGCWYCVNYECSNSNMNGMSTWYLTFFFKPFIFSNIKKNIPNSLFLVSSMNFSVCIMVAQWFEDHLLF